MVAYVKKTRLVFLVALVVSLAVTVFGIYLPMAAEIERNVVANFKLMAQMRERGFLEAVDKNVQAARSMASRTAIRDMLVAYRGGTVDLETLTSYTGDKYRDGARVIDNLSYAVRMVDGRQIAAFHGTDYQEASFEAHAPTDQLAYRFVQKGAVACLEITVPIVAEGVVLGHDFMGCCLNTILETLNGDADMAFALSPSGLTNQSLAPYGPAGSDLFVSETDILYLRTFDDTHEIVISEPLAALYRSKNALTWRTARNILIGYGLILALMYLALVSGARHQISLLSSDRDRFRNQADRDPLTDAYSRRYLDAFCHRHPHERGVVMMFDLDGFKGINDQFGHAMGDEALRLMAETLKQVLRPDDPVIRYGGDEFVVVLRQAVDPAQGEDVILRVRQALQQKRASSAFQFDIRFSVGIAPIERMALLDTALELADQRMYRNKHGGEPPAGGQTPGEPVVGV
jgi:diguanylate cyclase (GGDEF)-like protein